MFPLLVGEKQATGYGLDNAEQLREIWKQNVCGFWRGIAEFSLHLRELFLDRWADVMEVSERTNSGHGLFRITCSSLERWIEQPCVRLMSYNYILAFWQVEQLGYKPAISSLLYVAGRSCRCKVFSWGISWDELTSYNRCEHRWI